MQEVPAVLGPRPVRVLGEVEEGVSAAGIIVQPSVPYSVSFSL